MTIPKFSDGQTMFDVRVKSLNPAIDAVNRMDTSLTALSSLVDANTVTSDANATSIVKTITDINNLISKDQTFEASISALQGTDLHTINEVNTLKAEDVKLEVKIDAATAIAEGNTSVLSTVVSKADALEAFVMNLHGDVTNVGRKYKADYRVFDFTATSANYSVVVPLEAEEFPVRAAIRTFASNIGTFKPINTLTFNRTTNTLTFNVGNDRSGKIYCEFWGPV